MSRGGANAKKRAVVAVTWKLATVLHRPWVSGAPYEPARMAAQRHWSQRPNVAIHHPSRGLRPQL
jgi:hypothetical protein